jgi:hypothetical protein
LQLALSCGKVFSGYLINLAQSRFFGKRTQVIARLRQAD